MAGFIGRGSVLPAEALGLAGGGRVLLRPDRLLPDPGGAIQAEVVAVSFRGPGLVALLRLGSGQMVESDLPADAVQAPGSMLALRLAEDGLVRFP